MQIEIPVRRRGECCEVTSPLPASDAEQTVRVLAALADVTRLQMVAVLARSEQPVCVCDFTAQFELGQSTISHHVAKLRAAGLVESEKRGLWSYYRLRKDLPRAVSRLVDAAVTA